jgi:FAD/FMN-containing dehydrogenase
LFAAAIGGYGLFGVIVRVTLRLAPRRKLVRRVAMVSVDDLPTLFERRIDEGFEYGDCQFATDPGSRGFMQTGVLSCYRTVDGDPPVPPDQRTLSVPDWQRLLLLAHTDKSRAFEEYSRYYMSTDGQLYWSDTHQLASYIDGYHDAIDRQTGSAVTGSEMISELFVPREVLPAFLAAVRRDLRSHDVNLIYGTIRLVERDDESVLAWARERWACIVVNLHVDHCPEGVRKAEADFRRLIDIAAGFGGSYYLTYHRWATPQQIEQCHPRMREFLALKHACDPDHRFTSDWYEHHRRLMNGDSKER